MHTCPDGLCESTTVLIGKTHQGITFCWMSVALTQFVVAGEIRTKTCPRWGQSWGRVCVCVGACMCVWVCVRESQVSSPGAQECDAAHLAGTVSAMKRVGQLREDGCVTFKYFSAWRTRSLCPPVCSHDNPSVDTLWEILEHRTLYEQHPHPRMASLNPAG